MHLSAKAHWVKYFYFKELTVTKIHTFGKWLLNPASKAGMEIGFQAPSDQLERLLVYRSADFPNTGTRCCFHGHMQGNLKDLKKQVSI